MGKTRDLAANAVPRGYFEQSSDLLNSLLLVIPLLLIYEAGLLLTRGATMNGVDLITSFLLQNWGVTGLLVFNGALLVAGLVGAAIAKRERRFDPRIALPLTIESTVYALLLGIVITSIMRELGIGLSIPLQAGPQQHGVLAKVFLSLGAGVHEEIVFRLGLFSGLAWGLSRVAPRAAAVAGAVAISSILFSLAHHVVEPFRFDVFVYRALAGAIFCGLFTVRGFAVAVYTHAIYDVWVMVFLAR